MIPALSEVLRRIGNVVAQIVKAELVVRSIGNIRYICISL